MINQKTNKKGMAVSQIFSLILAIVAIAFFAGLQMPTVSAGPLCTDAIGSCVNLDEYSCASSLINDNDCSGGLTCCAIGSALYKTPAKTSTEYAGFDESQLYNDGDIKLGQYAPLPTQAATPTSDGGKSPLDTVTQIGGAVSAAGLVIKGGEKAAQTLGIIDKTDKAVKALELQRKSIQAAKSVLDTAKAGTSGVNLAAMQSPEALQRAKDAANLVTTTPPTPPKIGFFTKLVVKPDKLAALKDAKDALAAAKKAGTGIKAASKAQAAASVASKTTFGFGLQIAGMATLGAQVATMAFKLAGSSERNVRQVKTGAYTAAVAVTVTSMIFKSAIELAAIPGFGWYAAAAVAVMAGIYAAFTYQDYSQEIFTYQLNVWQPESKGEMCTECNELRYGCSEYQCKTYGAACTILNPGTEIELCEWNNSRDIKPPIMTQLDILDTGYQYNPNKDVELGDLGVELVHVNENTNQAECIPSFTAVKFGVKTDEPAECKIDLTRKYNYNEMVSFMAEGPVYTYNHTLAIPSSAFPSNYSLTEAGWVANAGADHSFYIRCRDVNDNISPYHLVMNFCVDQGPDTTAPTIATNYVNDAYITHNQSTIDDLEVYTNEPADCRWDYKDVDYKDMAETMTECSAQVGAYTFPTKYAYGCKTSLSGLKDGVKNNFYIRCQDKPLWEEGDKERRISNEESYKLSLQGTNPLVIESIVINNDEAYSESKEITKDFIFQDSTDTIAINMEVKSSQGADKVGSARCVYTPFGSNLRYEFYNNGNFDYTNENVNTFHLTEDYYDYDIRCCDLANNCDTANVGFIVDTDLTAPIIARTYYEERNMKIITDEEATCAYALETCNYLFEDGIQFTTKDNLDHFTKWDTSEDLYVKCKDRFGNVPHDTCSIIVRATDKYIGIQSNVDTSF